jgi:hypothetical protein
MPVIPATQKAEIRRIVVRSQPRQIVHETYLKNTHHNKRAGGVAEGEGSEFKPQYHQHSNLARGVVQLECLPSPGFKPQPQ